MCGKLSQQYNTQNQCGNACWDVGYAHILAMAMSTAVAYIWRPCDITKFYMYRIGNYPFQQTLYFVHFDLDNWDSSNNDHAIIVIMN